MLCSLEILWWYVKFIQCCFCFPQVLWWHRGNWQDWVAVPEAGSWSIQSQPFWVGRECSAILRFPSQLCNIFCSSEATWSHHGAGLAAWRTVSAVCNLQQVKRFSEGEVKCVCNIPGPWLMWLDAGFMSQSLRLRVDAATLAHSQVYDDSNQAAHYHLHGLYLWPSTCLVTQ
jgi:hypothetical protein